MSDYKEKYIQGLEERLELHKRLQERDTRILELERLIQEKDSVITNLEMKITQADQDILATSVKRTRNEKITQSGQVSAPVINMKKRCNDSKFTKLIYFL